MKRSVVTELRDIVPIRPLTRIEALTLAERQALALLEAVGITEAPVPERVVADLPRIEVTRSTRLGHSGASAWEHGRWRVLLNANDSRLRQRFSLMHEFKHILDHPFVDQLYGALDAHERDDWIELICDYFAGCVLIPRPWLKRAYTTGNQRLGDLAWRFDVSQAAMQTRLYQTGLVRQAPRCSHRRSQRPTRYFRRSANPVFITLIDDPISNLTI